MARSPRLLVIGLDGSPPELLFGPLECAMPNLTALMRRGARAKLESADPPITIPAWPVMFTGVDPGTLGFYGFRHRTPGTYTETYVPNSSMLPVPTLWTILSETGRRVAVVGMPPGFPPPAVNGVYIADFLTPSGQATITYPASLRAEIESKFGPYRFDVVFRAHERVKLLEDIIEMTRQRFAISEYLLEKERWDVFALHEIGTDRFHHAYWKYFDRNHPEFVPGNPFEHSAERYYAEVDAGIGRLVRAMGDDTIVLVVSDHGAMRMDGCFCVNQWLIDEGYMVLKKPVATPTPIERAEVDWSRTRAWGAGGYYARLFLNLKGRDPMGMLSAKDAAKLTAEILDRLRSLKTPEGKPLTVDARDPRRIYRETRGDAPDLMLYFDDLRWRSAGSIGHPSWFLKENDTGPDDAVHSRDGIFVVAVPGRPGGVELPRQSILDVTPTVLRLLGEPIPAHIQGRPISALPANGP